MLKRTLICLLVALVALAAMKLWLWEAASKPTSVRPSFGDMPVNNAARDKRY